MSEVYAPVLLVLHVLPVLQHMNKTYLDCGQRPRWFIQGNPSQVEQTLRFLL